MPNTSPRRSKGFTLIELLVVVAIMMVLVALILGAVSMVRGHGLKVQAEKQVREIAAAAQNYHMKTNHYPPDTGSLQIDGTTSPFPSYGDPAEANAIYMYLGRRLHDSRTDTTFGPLLTIHLSHLRKLGSVDNVMVDPWGTPYFMDCVHSQVGSGATVTGSKTGSVAEDVNVQPQGPPCPPGTPSEDQTHSIKVWSAGPDKKVGPVPFSHVTTPTAPEDKDNIPSSL